MRTSSPSAARQDCAGCAAAMAAILHERTLQASFRPIVDFGRCEICGYIAGVRAPAAFLPGSLRRLQEIARHVGLQREFGRAYADAAIRRFVDSGGNGALFLPLAADAVEEPAFADTLRAVAAEHGLPASQLVAVMPDVDERHIAAAVDFARRLTAAGIGLAARSLGCELAERQLWSLVAPAFAVLDGELFEDLDPGAVPDAAWIEPLTAQIRRGRRIVADGIRNARDFRSLRALGIAFGAGEFFGRGAAKPTRTMPAAAYKAVSADCGNPANTACASGGVLDRLLVRQAPVTPTTSADAVFMLFEDNPDVRAVAVVADGAPRGLIARYDMVDNMARPFRHELYGRKPCTRFMDAQPLVVDIGVSLQELAETVIGADPRHLISGFIITERGRYLGMGSVQDLVREVTSMQIEAAKYANPLTQLPGNVPINQHIDNLLAGGESCCVAYGDLDHFKPFNDVYGYAKGDEVIRLTAQVLTEACDPERDFLGHVGGDDFVVIFRSDDWEGRCKAALQCFAEGIRAFFSPDDIERGGYVTENRKGQMEFHGLTSLSIGAVEVAPGMFQNHLQVSKVAAEVKKRAKAIQGNSLYVNRRIYSGGEEVGVPHDAAR